MGSIPPNPDPDKTPILEPSQVERSCLPSGTNDTFNISKIIIDLSPIGKQMPKTLHARVDKIIDHKCFDIYSSDATLGADYHDPW